MTTPSESNTSTCSSNSKSFDYGNPLCTLLFGSLGLESALRHAWIDSVIWLLLAACFALMIGAPGLSGDNWKKPRSLLACVLLLGATAAMITRIVLDLRRPPTTKPARE